jgi:single stranded DNA-binding protein
MALSKIQIIGNLGRDPELRYTPSGRPVATFTVAVNQSQKNQQTNEWIESTDWFRVSIWGDRGERAAENLRKGSRVFVDGRFRSSRGRRPLGRLRRHRDRRAAVLGAVVTTTSRRTPPNATYRSNLSQARRLLP